MLPVNLMNLENALIYFINEGILAGKTPSTLKGYQYSVSSLLKYIKSLFLPQELSQITSDVLQGFMMNGIKVRKWNRYTLWTQHKNLTAFFNWCVRKEYVSSNPLVSLPKPSQPPQAPKSLNEKEILMLLRVVANMPSHHYFTKLRNKAMIAMFIFTGLRKNELICLKYTHVDLVNGFIQVEEGKGGKKREIPIEQAVLKPALEEYVEYRSRLFKTSEWFFTGTFSGRGSHDNKLAISTIDRFFVKLSKLMNKHIHAHKLRHSFATLFLDKTGDLYVLKELLGHSSIKTTTIYLSTTRTKKVEAINKLKIATH